MTEFIPTLDELMRDMPYDWRIKWCKCSGLCDCMGSANRHGNVTTYGYTEEDVIAYNLQHPIPNNVNLFKESKSMDNFRYKVENRLKEILSNESYSTGRWFRCRAKLMALGQKYDVQIKTKSITLEQSLEVIKIISDDELIDMWAIVITTMHGSALYTT